MDNGLVISITPLDVAWKNLRVVAENNGSNITARAIAAVEKKFKTAEKIELWISVTTQARNLDESSKVKTSREYYCGTYYPQEKRFDPNGGTE